LAFVFSSFNKLADDLFFFAVESLSEKVVLGPAKKRAETMERDFRPFASSFHLNVAFGFCPNFFATFLFAFEPNPILMEFLQVA
jgi:hypothetical protein